VIDAQSPYSMFCLRRMREERARGNETEAALEAAAATSGRAVLFSGVTVAIAMARAASSFSRSMTAATATRA